MRIFSILILFILAHSVSHAQDLKNRSEELPDPQIISDKKNDNTNESKTFSYVSVMPEPTFNFSAYIQKNLHYPKEAIEKRITGFVVVRFIVNEDGSISDVCVTKGIGGGCDEEAIRLIKNMPAWKSGSSEGVPVKVNFSQPINFRL